MPRRRFSDPHLEKAYRIAKLLKDLHFIRKQALKHGSYSGQAIEAITRAKGSHLFEAHYRSVLLERKLVLLMERELNEWIKKAEKVVLDGEKSKGLHAKKGWNNSKIPSESKKVKRVGKGRKVQRSKSLRKRAVKKKRGKKVRKKAGD